MSIIDAAVRQALWRKKMAWQVYKTALFATDEPTEETVEEFIEAVRIIGLPWTEVRGDESALAQRRTLEAQIAAAEQKFAAAKTLAAESQAKVDALTENRLAGFPKDLGNDFNTPTDNYRRAMDDQRVAGITIDKCETKLRELRVDKPRAFGRFPDVTLDEWTPPPPELRLRDLGVVTESRV